jgi:hypothetical protein
MSNILKNKTQKVSTMISTNMCSSDNLFVFNKILKNTKESTRHVGLDYGFILEDMNNNGFHTTSQVSHPENSEESRTKGDSSTGKQQNEEKIYKVTQKFESMKHTYNTYSNVTTTPGR